MFICLNWYMYFNKNSNKLIILYFIIPNLKYFVKDKNLKPCDIITNIVSSDNHKKLKNNSKL